mmetsp:Transcript_21530/g.44895  ORF Transcript_21530/g.44895 Transcript_21530/m.44895 type:complete len:494 (-) Transcript_21530:8-1489(-)
MEATIDKPDSSSISPLELGGVNVGEGFEANTSNVTYLSLLKGSRSFRLYILSYLITQCGSWLNFIATLSLLTRILRGGKEDQDEIDNLPVALLLFLRMLPPLIVSPLVGGPIADFFDKRVTMVVIDCGSTLVAFILFPLAAQTNSLFILYSSVLLLSTLDSIYNPVKNSILPFMLRSDNEVNKATQLMAISWSVMGAVGAAVGGMLTGVGGVRFCFLIDGVTFAISALLMYRIGSRWRLADSAAEARKEKGNTADAEGKKKEETSQMEKMLGGVRYLRGEGRRWAPLVFFKAYGCIQWGAADLLNVVFADGNEYSLGFIFGMVGVGCLVGPIMADKAISRNQGGKSGEVEPRKMVWSCFVAVCMVAVSFWGMSFSASLSNVLVWTFFRSAGSAVLWVYSSVLLQILVDPDVLGRVIAIEYSSAVGNEGISSFIAAFVIDELDFSVLEVCGCVGFVGTCISVPLGFYVCRNWKSEVQRYQKLSMASLDEEEGEE